MTMGRYSRRTPPSRIPGIHRSQREETFFFVLIGLSILLHLALAAIFNRSATPRMIHRPPTVTVDLFMAPVANPRRGSGTTSRAITKAAVPVAVPKEVKVPSKAKGEVVVKGKGPKKSAVTEDADIRKEIARMKQRLAEQAEEEDALKAIAAMRKKNTPAMPVTTVAGVPDGKGDEVGSAIGDWLGRSVKAKWAWPDQKRKDLSAEVEVEFDKGGNIVNPRVIRSSGEALFDKSLLSALRKLEPLPKPLRKPFKETFIFNLDDLQGQ